MRHTGALSLAGLGSGQRRPWVAERPRRETSAREPRWGSDREPAGQSPESRKDRRSQGQGCLTAEITERHGAQVPGIPKSSPLARRRSGVSMATHWAPDGALPGPKRLEAKPTGPCAHALYVPERGRPAGGVKRDAEGAGVACRLPSHKQTFVLADTF